MKTRKQTLKMVAYNPETRRTEEVFPESEVKVSDMSPRFWVASEMVWVSVPGVTAEEVYQDWLAQA